MNTKLLPKVFTLTFVMVMLALSAVQPGLARPDAAVVMDGDGNVYDPATGALVFVGTSTGAAAEFAPQNAGEFVSAYASRMGLNQADLVLSNTLQRPNGRKVLRYHQVYRGIPVFASDVIVNVTPQGAMSSLTAKTSPDLDVDVNPAISEEDAKTGALDEVATYYELNVTELNASLPELQIYDARMLHLDTQLPRLAWKVLVGAQNQAVSEVVLVDAQDGSLILHYSQIDRMEPATGQARQPGNNLALVSAHRSRPEVGVNTLGVPMLTVYDLGGALPDPAQSSQWNLPGNFKCDQSAPANCNTTDSQNAYQNALEFYNFFATHHARDSVDKLGATINSSINFGPSGSNVFWVAFPTNSVVYSPNMAAVDDLAGHALFFGVTVDESNLMLYYQAGAISESFSDMWGEFIDQTNGRGNDTPGVKWLFGEDAPGGTQRSMTNPPAFSHPDKMTSIFYQTGSTDFGGIHANAGINNKAVALLVDGGTFNGQTVSALGMEKVADIYYEAQINLLSSASTYFDLYYALQQACINRTGIDGGSGAVTAVDCQQVLKALNAVEMNKAVSITPVAAFCPTFTKGHDLFYDGFETDMSKWAVSNAYSGDQWIIAPGGATDGANYLHGPEPGLKSQAIVQTLNAVHLPAGRTTYLYFRHSVDMEFQNFPLKFFDGGVLQYNVDGSAVWKDVAPLFSGGKNYGGTLDSTRDNPQKGKQAFVAFAGGDYVPSRYNLTSLAGHNLKFRWIMASDNQNEGTGWDLDSVRIYNCVRPTSKPTLSAPANNLTTLDFTPLLDWSNSTPDLDYYKVQVSLNAAFTSLVVDAITGVSSYTPTLQPNRKYYWRVSAYNAADQTQGWTAARQVNTSLLKPSLLSPGNGTLQKTNRPIFDWSDSFNAASYTIQISRSTTFSPLVLSKTTPTSNYVPTVNLPNKTKLYWRVKANGAYPSVWTVARSLTTGNPPSVPVLLSPATNILVTSYSPMLKWKKVTLSPGTAFSFYLIQVDDNADFSSPYISTTKANINTLSFTVTPALNPNTLYYWRVQAWSSGANFSAWSAVRTIRAAMLPPTLVFPVGGNSGSLMPTFDWNDVTGATSYTIQVSTVSDFSSLVINTGVGTSQYTPPSNLPTGTLFWRVLANGANGPSLWATSSFTSP